MSTSNAKELYQNYLRKFRKKSLIFNKAFRYISHPKVWMERSRLAAAAPLSSDEKTVLEKLRQDNFHSADNLVDRDLLRELQAEAEKYVAGAADAPRSKNKDFWSHLLPRDLDGDSVFTRFALQENILNLVGAYFGESPFLQDVNIMASFGTTAGKWKDSQLWHQDYNDSKVLKLWVYISDVLEPEDGPFTYLPGGPSLKVPNPFQRRVTDETMAEVGMDKQAVAVVGPKSTTFLIDTRRCYHQGSRVAQGHMRVAYVASYVSFATLSGSGNQIKSNGAKLSRRQQLAVRRA